MFKRMKDYITTVSESESNSSIESDNESEESDKDKVHFKTKIGHTTVAESNDYGNL